MEETKTWTVWQRPSSAGWLSLVARRAAKIRKGRNVLYLSWSGERFAKGSEYADFLKLPQNEQDSIVRQAKELHAVRYPQAGDPFARLPVPEDRDEFLRIAFLGAMVREHGVTLLSVDGRITPLAAFPWTPERARALRRTLQRVEKSRTFLQEHADVFPALTPEDARRWVADLRRHHGAGAWPTWWPAELVGIARKLACGC